jgi:hypothetical protein
MQKMRERERERGKTLDEIARNLPLNILSQHVPETLS